jgi:predicted anti-sigma-YlaC factor YlaD
VDEHLDESSALFLVALEAQDAERRAAEAHIATCTRCRAVWNESVQLIAMLDGAARPEPISAALMQRVHAAVANAQPEPRRWYAHASLWGLLAGALCSLGLFWARIGAPLPPGVELRPGLSWGCARYELALGAAAFAVGLLWSRAVARELGPARASLVAMSGALVGQWLLASRCEAEQTALHLLLFHVAGVGLSALLGAAAGGLQHSLGKARA